MTILLRNKIQEASQFKMLQFKARFKAVWIAVKWKRNKRKWGENLDVIHRHKLRRHANFIVQCKYDGISQKALQTLKQ